MMNVLAQKVRESCPNIKVLRKAISYIRKNQLTRHLLTTSQIEQAENSYETKKQIVHDFIKKNKKSSNKINKSIDTLFSTAPCFQNRLTDCVGGGYLQIDIFFCHIAYGFTPREYIWYELENKGYGYRNQFVSCRDKHIYQCVVNDMVDSALVTDKAYTYKIFQDAFKRDAIIIENNKDFDSFKSFISKHPTFVGKQVYTDGGKGVKRIDSSKYESNMESLFKSITAHGKVLIEEILIQDEEMKNLNPDSVNTVRIVTFNTRHGIEIPYVFFRIGRSGSFVDNGASMGISVGVDPETGTVNTDGYNELNEHFEFHPESGIRFKGIRLPDWKEAISIVKECSKRLPSLKSVSWDMAYARTEGNDTVEWKMIEANAMGDFLNQMVTKKGIKSEMERLIKETDTMIAL